MPRAISKTVWDQIKIARAAGASYGDLAEKTGIPKGTILAHAHRHGWSKDIALARPKSQDAQPAAPNVTEAIASILFDRGQQTKMHLSEFLVKTAKRLAERGEDVSIDTIEAVKAFEQIRASLFPSPTMIDHRSVSVSVSGGLSEEALERIEAMTKLM
jgi:hypothetical protein